MPKIYRVDKRKLRLALIALVPLVCVSYLPYAIAIDTIEYDLAVSESLEAIHVEVCARTNASLEFDVGELFNYPANFQSQTTLEHDGARLRLPAGSNCFQYRINTVGLNSLARRTSADRQNLISANINQLLACPRTSHQVRRVVNFSLPKGSEVSLPGTRIRSKKHRFELLARPCSWESLMLIGQVYRFDLALGNTDIHAAIVGTMSQRRAAKLQAWLSEGAQAITKLYGKFPVQSLQVLIVPTGSSDDPVPWGEVNRGGGDAVHLYVDETRPLADLSANWVLTHELSHLLHPYGRGADAWFSEGIASYYQNVLRGARWDDPSRACMEKTYRRFRSWSASTDCTANTRT